MYRIMYIRKKRLSTHVGQGTLLSAGFKMLSIINDGVPGTGGAGLVKCQVCSLFARSVNLV